MKERPESEAYEALRGPRSKFRRGPRPSARAVPRPPHTAAAAAPSAGSSWGQSNLSSQSASSNVISVAMHTGGDDVGRGAHASTFWGVASPSAAGREVSQIRSGGRGKRNQKAAWVHPCVYRGGPTAPSVIMLCVGSSLRVEGRRRQPVYQLTGLGFIPARAGAGPSWSISRQALLFLLTGLQARTVMEGLGTIPGRQLVLHGAVISLVVVVTRFLWVYPEPICRAGWPGRSAPAIPPSRGGHRS